MATVTLTPSSNTTTTHLRDASFSSYLNCSEEAYVRKLADENFRFGRKKGGEDGEIGVFGAEKYFNEGRDNEEYPRMMMLKNTEESEFARNEGVPMKASPQPITPSVYSESSSWNSQSALLKQNVLKKPPHHHKRRSRSLLTSIRCINCSCNDNKSVDIGVRTPKTSLDYGVFEGIQTINSNNLVPINKAELNPWIMKQIQSRKIDETKIDDGFTFPVLSSGNLTRQNEIPKRASQLYSLNLDRRTAVLPWTPPNSGGLEEESESDASSDLFEIEDFVSNGKSHNLSHGMSCYAPSEASIEWSVVTASAADFEDSMPSSEGTTSRGYKMSSNGKGGKESEKRRSGILSGCKSQKAVMVAGDAYRTHGKAVRDPRTPYRSDSFEGATRFEAEAGKIALIRKNRPYSFDLGALSR